MVLFLILLTLMQCFPFCHTQFAHTGLKTCKAFMIEVEASVFWKENIKKIKLKTARLMQFQCLCGRIFFLFLCQVTWTCTSSHSFLLLDLQGIVGNLSSGKSALVHRYLTGTYVQEESPEGKSLLKKAWVRRWITTWCPAQRSEHCRLNAACLPWLFWPQRLSCRSLSYVLHCWRCVKSWFCQLSVRMGRLGDHIWKSVIGYLNNEEQHCFLFFLPLLCVFL